jgi:NADPH-dependent ferric siderophore reductase
MNDISVSTVSRHQITRVRRETRRRTLTVTAVERLTPQMQRVRFASPELSDFSSSAPDDHIKLFVPATAEQGGDTAGRCMRDYTPRAFDPAQGTLTVDFALHEAGPATAWALNARVGDMLEIGGPRGSQVVADDFDWYLLIGDETALPSIGRRVEELRPGVPVITIVVTDTAADVQSFTTTADWRPLWIARNPASGDDAGLLQSALADYVFPPGDGYVWVAAEAQTARSIRSYLIDIRQHPRSWLKASGYWARGREATHETID